MSIWYASFPGCLKIATPINSLFSGSTTNSPHPSSFSHFTETIASSKGFIKVPSPGVRDEYSLKRFLVCEQKTFASTDISPIKTAHCMRRVKRHYTDFEVVESNSISYSCTLT